MKTRKALLSIFILVISCHYGFSQGISERLNESKLKYDLLSKEIFETKRLLGNRSSSQINVELGVFKDELLSVYQTSKDSVKLKKLNDTIVFIGKQLDTIQGLESVIGKKQLEISELNDKIILLQSIAQLVGDKELANDLSKQSNQSYVQAKSDAIKLLAGNINGWLGLCGSINSLNTTAQNMIVFDEETNGSIAKRLLTGSLDIVTIGFGALTINAYNNNNQNGKIGFPILMVVGKLGSELLKNYKAKQALEGLTRNVVLGDIINKNLNITKNLSHDIDSLHRIVFPDQNGELLSNNLPVINWKPTTGDIELFKKIIEEINTLSLFLIDIQEQAKILLQSNETMTKDSKDGLNRLISDVNRNQQDWFRSKLVFQPYLKFIEEDLKK
jgi:hypothetical protein